MPKEIALIVRYETGSHILRHSKLVEVIEDGKRRAPKTDNLDIAIMWLMKNNYQVQDFTWLDRTGLLSRHRRQVYTRQAN